MACSVCARLARKAAWPCPAPAPCDSCKRKIKKNKLRLFKFNGRNARGDSTSEATTVPVMLEKQLPALTLDVPVDVELSLAWSCLSSWLIRLMDWFEWLCGVQLKFADWSRRVDYNHRRRRRPNARCWEFNQKCQRRHNISNCKQQQH